MLTTYLHPNVVQIGPIAWQIRELADEGFVLDSILNVVDCKNFEGYADNSYTAKLQAQYTDLVLLTKHEGVSITCLWPISESYCFQCNCLQCVNS